MILQMTFYHSPPATPIITAFSLVDTFGGTEMFHTCPESSLSLFNCSVLMLYYGIYTYLIYMLYIHHEVQTSLLVHTIITTQNFNFGLQNYMILQMTFHQPYPSFSLVDSLGGTEMFKFTRVENLACLFSTVLYLEHSKVQTAIQNTEKCKQMSHSLYHAPALMLCLQKYLWHLATPM